LDQPKRVKQERARAEVVGSASYQIKAVKIAVGNFVEVAIGGQAITRVKGAC
jgi:hypothetical protein